MANRRRRSSATLFIISALFSLMVLPSSALAAWLVEGSTTETCVTMGAGTSGRFLTCRNTFTADGAQNTPVLRMDWCDNATVVLEVSGGATSSGFIQVCSDLTPTVCVDLHTTALDGSTVAGYTHGGPLTYVRGRMTAVTLGAGASRLIATCAAGN